MLGVKFVNLDYVKQIGKRATTVLVDLIGLIVFFTKPVVVAPVFVKFGVGTQNPTNIVTSKVELSPESLVLTSTDTD